ncbi:DUF1642 domain-containing protein [Streptococcus parasanguinis]|jgi:hypothetical protein|uniref:DUF1642 domain-containing protein n=1 Tax=Streptococcus parasanguinis TaxID=1318 RepID=UPI00325BE3F7
MNKQELIEKYKSSLNKVHKVYGDYYKTEAYEEVLKDLKRLDEPQRVTVPQIVADYIEYTKATDWDLQEAMDDVAYEDNKDLRKWFNDNIETFARAWLDGYTIEKEKRYLVKIVGMDNINGYLSYNKKLKKWFFGIASESRPYRSKHTRKELEDAGFGEVFNCPLFEIEEVEE